jgi:hypothetical protein
MSFLPHSSKRFDEETSELIGSAQELNLTIDGRDRSDSMRSTHVPAHR